MSTQDLTVPASLAARVRAGVAFLDGQTPGWPDRIVVQALNMASTCNCVLGQVYGNFDRADARFFGADDAAAVRLGFDARFQSGEFDKLRRLWAYVVRTRQAVAP